MNGRSIGTLSSFSILLLYCLKANEVYLLLLLRIAGRLGSFLLTAINNETKSVNLLLRDRRFAFVFVKS